MPSFEVEQLQELLSRRLRESDACLLDAPEHRAEKNVHLAVGGIKETRKAISLLHGLDRNDETGSWLDRSDMFFKELSLIGEPTPPDSSLELLPIAVFSGYRSLLAELLRLDNTAPVDGGGGRPLTKASSPWYLSVKAMVDLATGGPVVKVLEQWSQTTAALPSDERLLAAKRSLTAAIVEGSEAMIVLAAEEANALRLEGLRNEPFPFELVDQWNTALLVIAKRSGLAVPMDLPTLPVHIARPEWRD